MSHSLAEGRTLIELPKGYGSLAQGDIFNRAVMIGQGDIAGALPPNKKLGTFYENLLGNLRPVTVDVNALRGPIIEQGDPRWLASKLVEKDDKGILDNLTVGNMHQSFSKMIDWNIWNKLNTKTWASMAFVMNA